MIVLLKTSASSVCLFVRFQLWQIHLNCSGIQTIMGKYYNMIMCKISFPFSTVPKTKKSWTWWRGMILWQMILFLLVWNMWTDSVAVRHQWQTALHQTVIFIFISFNLFIYLSLYLYLYLNRYTEQDHHHFWNIISITMSQNKFDDGERYKKYYLRMTKILFGRAGLLWAHLHFRNLRKNFINQRT